MLRFCELSNIIDNFLIVIVTCDFASNIIFFVYKSIYLNRKILIQLGGC